MNIPKGHQAVMPYLMLENAFGIFRFHAGGFRR